MEYALAESSVFVPPVILAVLLFVYRHSILPFAENNLFNQLILHKTQFIVILTNSFKMIVRGFINMTESLFQQIDKYQELFRNTSHQVVLARKTAYDTLSNNTKKAFDEVLQFFRPPPKTLWDQTILAGAVALGILVLLGTWWYLQSSKPNLETSIEEDYPLQEKLVVQKKPVRRRRRAT